MIELRSIEQLTKAVERAKAGKLLVRFTSIYRQYIVNNLETGTEYTINFFVRKKKRYGHCTCKAGERNLACKHLAAAAGLHMMVALSQQYKQALSQRRLAT